MHRTITCILCPNGCEIRVEHEGAEVLHLEGNLCPRGAEYVRREIVDPVRNIASSVLVEGGSSLLCSMRLSAPIPKARIMDVMAQIRALRVPAPVAIGDVLIEDVLGLGANVIATRNVEKI